MERIRQTKLTSYYVRSARQRLFLSSRVLGILRAPSFHGLFLWGVTHLCDLEAGYGGDIKVGVPWAGIEPWTSAWKEDQIVMNYHPRAYFLNIFFANSSIVLYEDEIA